jgi:hypothetical protein
MISPDNPQTPRPPGEFDFGAYPPDTLFHDRRGGADRRAAEPPEPEAATRPAACPNRRRQDRRRRIDPTTFEKQYTADELEFMTAMQRYKVRTGKAFPTHAEVLEVAYSLGYRQIAERSADRPEWTEGRRAIPEGPHDGPDEAA